MASTQQMLASTRDLQQNAQAALPVIPNNGNPAGAYNMPQSTQVPAKPAGPDLSWLQPSAHMQSVNATLQALQQNIDMTKPPATVVQQPQAPVPVLPQATPVMPALNTSGVVLPQTR